MDEPALHQLDLDFAADQRSGTLQCGQRHIARRVEQAIDLRPTGLQHDGETRLAQRLLLHGFNQLPDHDFLDGQRLRFFEDTVLFEEVVEA